MVTTMVTTIHTATDISPIAKDLALAAVESWSAANIHAAMEKVANDLELKFGKIGQPLRVAVTGGPVSPPIDITVELVGKERSLARLAKALSYVDDRVAAG